MLPGHLGSVITEHVHKKVTWLERNNKLEHEGMCIHIPQG